MKTFEQHLQEQLTEPSQYFSEYEVTKAVKEWLQEHQKLKGYDFKTLWLLIEELEQ